MLCSSLEAADTLLSELASRAEKVESLSGSFVQQRFVSVLPLPLLSEGFFKYHQAEGVEWQTVTPLESKIIITGSGLQLEDGSSFTVGSGGFSKALLAIFSGRFDLLREHFTILSKGDISLWELELTPRSELVAGKIASILISGKETTEKVVITETNGDVSSISLMAETIVDGE